MASSKFSPPVHRGMEVLDRSLFNKEVALLVAYFPNPRFLGNFVKACHNDILQVQGVKHIVAFNGTKGVLLTDSVDMDSYKEKLSPQTLQKISEYGVQVAPYTLHLDYSFWKADDILHAIIPEHLLNDIPTGYAQAGHIAHFNLRNDFKKYGPLIGQIVLDKNPKIETVVDKVDTIDTKFRTFKMEVLAGKDDFIVEQSESGCKFRFDFSGVYWNSRLSTEHERLIRQFQPGEAVGDVFAGVGPFAVPAGRKNVFVLANDLNPESYRYLKENVTRNHVTDFVRSHNLDGRQFIRDSPRMLLDWAREMRAIERMPKRRRIKKAGDDSKLDPKLAIPDRPAADTPSRAATDPAEGTVKDNGNDKPQVFRIPKYITHYAMNLPDSALTFLNEFIGLYTRDAEVLREVKSDPDFVLPTINVHCFEKFSADEKPEPSMQELHRRVHARIVKYMDHAMPFDHFHFHLVRKVAPTKPMFCVTFQLPQEVAFKSVQNKHPDLEDSNAQSEA